MKNVKLISVMLLLLTPIYIHAKSTNVQGQQGSSVTTPQQQGQGSTSSGTGAAYQNQVQTQNQGAEQQLQVSTQQQVEGDKLNGSGATLSDHASNVAKYVQGLLNSTTLTGGIGDQVRELARLQNQSQEKVMLQVTSVDNRNKLLKMVLGTNYGAVKTMQQEMERNQERVRNLLQLKEQITNLTDKEDVQALIHSLNTQNLSIQEKVQNELKQFSLFGWLFNLLNK